MKCKLCGAEKETRRQMHGHLMRCHYEDYARGDFLLDRFVDKAVPLAREYRKNEDIKRHERPAGFRFLCRSDETEALAIDRGFDFIDDDQNIYTEQEARAEKWI